MPWFNIIFLFGIVFANAHVNERYHSLKHSREASTLVPLFIIGDSTAHNITSIKHKRVEWGWGDLLSHFMKNPDLLYNKARSGSSTKTYYQDIPSWNTDHYWGDGIHPSKFGKKGLAQLIEESNTSNGGFLLIYFGGNDAMIHKEPDYYTQTVPERNLSTLSVQPKNLSSYESFLKKFIDFALEHHLTPVLLSLIHI